MNRSGIPEEVRTLIFDLGGVIIDLDPEHTVRKLSMLPHRRREKVDIKALAALNIAFETGKLDEAAFRSQLRGILRTTATDRELDTAWNGMLQNIPAARVQLLEELKENYRLILLSNTNTIHLREVCQRLQAVSGYENFDSLFHACYYSHLEGLKKPNPELFLHVIEENGLDPATTVFLDDLKENLEGAACTGLQTAHIDTPERLFELFSYEPQP